jgi:HSP20 family protein
MDLDEWFRRFAESPMGRFGFGAEGRRGGGGASGSVFSEFEEMRREMERIMEETIQDQNRLPKDLIREYETHEGGKVKEVGPIGYGYSMTVGPDGKRKLREFGNVRPMGSGSIAGGGVASQLAAEREPMADIVTTDKEVKQ